MDGGLKDLQNLMRRARSSPDKTGTTRKNALRQIIDATRSSYPQVKIFAARNMAELFPHFPDLEEEAVNAIYDLCEDPDSQVRIEGYTTLSMLSKVENKWVKRNADVLVQLLQSDEPNEVNVVRKALVEHLKLDSRVTLGVFCDQVVPSDEPMDEEESQMRDRLRTLVLDFVANEVKKDQWRKLAIPGSEAEGVLISGLMLALSKSGDVDSQTIAKDILLQLPSFNSRSPQTNELCQAILLKAKDSRSLDMDSGTTTTVASLNRTRPYLDLLRVMFLEKQLGDLESLLRFYQPLVSKPVLQRLSQQDQVFVISNFAETLAAINPTEQQSVRNILAFSNFCFDCLSSANLTQRQSHRACSMLLQATAELSKGGWQIPGPVASSLEALERALSSKPEDNKDLQELIRPLISKKVEAPPTPPMSMSAPSVTKTDKTLQLAHPLPQRPPVSIQRPKPDTNNPKPADSSSNNSSPSTSRKHSLNPEDAQWGNKKAKKGGGYDPDTPSLLSRLATNVTNGGSSNSHQMGDQKHPQQPPNRGQGLGLSIKGAARLHHPHSDDNSSRSERPDEATHTSLMARLDSNNAADGERNGQRRRRKRNG
ncbi:hypothetical protein PQX77_004523 [Marasmius sp. AFHP31]|nr:hypothetical protein PQX77_004523 [Marasmius sp. AFHP31]